MTAYHAVTESPMYMGQQIIFDEKHHSGVYQRVYKIDIVNDVYTNSVYKLKSPTSLWGISHCL